jgi:hypothetical protein
MDSAGGVLDHQPDVSDKKSTKTFGGIAASTFPFRATVLDVV